MDDPLRKPIHSKLMLKLLALNPARSYFTVFGGRVLAKRPYNRNALMEHLLTHILYGKTIAELPEELQWLYPRIPETLWCNPACAIHLFGRRISPDSVRDMKQHIARASIVYLKDGVYMLKDYGRHGELDAWKPFDESSEADQVWAERQFEVARERREKYLDKMQAIIFGEPESGPPSGASSAEASL